jgi:predicted nucleic-acid-binding protein
LTSDHPKQALAARELFASGPIWLAKTVLLETNWVLRSVYAFEDSAIRAALTRVLGLKNVTTEDAPAVAGALKLAGRGLEFADALHLSSRPPGVRFASFDRALVQRAKRSGVSSVDRV